MWQKKGELTNIHRYTENCNRLCQYINIGSLAIQEIKLLGFVDNGVGILIKFMTESKAMEYKNFFGFLHNHVLRTIQQHENAVLIKTCAPVFLISFIKGLNHLTHYPEVLDIEASIFNELDLDLSKICTLEPKDEPAQSASLDQLAQACLAMIIQEGPIIKDSPFKGIFGRYDENSEIKSGIMDIQVDNELAPRY